MEPRWLAQPFLNLLLAAGFEWGIALHDLEVGEVIRGNKPKDVAIPQLKEFARKAGRQIGRTMCSSRR